MDNGEKINEKNMQNRELNKTDERSLGTLRLQHKESPKGGNSLEGLLRGVCQLINSLHLLQEHRWTSVEQ